MEQSMTGIFTEMLQFDTDQSWLPGVWLFDNQAVAVLFDQQTLQTGLQSVLLRGFISAEFPVSRIDSVD